MDGATPAVGLRRELGVFGAAMLGLGSIIGTGVFVSIGLAAGIAGPAVIVAISLAALLAGCNALSSAQLAAAYPVSGGTYEYGYRLLRPEIGFTAGWMFLCAKSASAATAAIGAAGYTFHLFGLKEDGLLPWAGCGLAVLLMLLVLGGLRRSSMVNIVIVGFTLMALAALAAFGISALAGEQGSDNFTPFIDTGKRGRIEGLFYATALMFVAYTGYGRIATMGEEVKSPERTIPRAIVLTLIVSASLYVFVAIAAIATVGSDTLAGATGESATPLEVVARALDVPGLTLLVSVAAITAMLGVLLNLILGLSRVALAMGRRRDLPHVLSHLDGSGSPVAAVTVVGIAIAGLSLIGDVSLTWGFSAFTVLIYYAITNLAALRLSPGQRLYPRLVPLGGLAGCLFLAAFLPSSIWLPGLGVIGAGLLWHYAVRRLR